MTSEENVLYLREIWLGGYCWGPSHGAGQARVLVDTSCNPCKDPASSYGPISRCQELRHEHIFLGSHPSHDICEPCHELVHLAA